MKQIHDAGDGCVVTARVGRAGRDAVEWTQWQKFTLYVQKDPIGMVCGIGIRNFGWADYDPRGLDATVGDNGVLELLAEDYYMEISACGQ